MEFGEGHVEGLLGAVRTGAGVTDHRAAIAEGFVAHADGVAEASLLADLGEEASAHTAGEHAFGGAGGVVIGAADRGARPRERDLRLLRVLLQVVGLRRVLLGHGLDGLALLPVAEQPFDLGLQRLPLDVPGHGEDRTVRAKEPAMLLLHVVDRQRFDVFGAASAILVQRRGIVAATQFHHHFLLRRIFEAEDVLQREGLHRFEFVFGKMRAANHIREDVQCRGSVRGKGGAPEPHVDSTDAFVAVDAEVIQGEAEGAGVAFAGPSGDEVREDGGDAELAGGIEGGSGGHEKVDRGRTDVLHSFREQNQSVRQGMLEDLLSHCGLAMSSARPSRPALPPFYETRYRGGGVVGRLKSSKYW